MPIKDLQHKLRELGRIRLGDRSGTRGAPKRLETFRFTSANKTLIAAIAEKYGGDVEAWDDSPRGREWQVTSAAAEIDILVPPGIVNNPDQWYELWSGGGLQRRCDGETEQVQMRSCICPSDTEDRLALAKQGGACDAITRLWLMLPGIAGIGTWRLETGSFYAAQELGGVTQMLGLAAARNLAIEAVLRIEPRTIKRPNQSVHRFSVPVIDARVPIDAFMAGATAIVIDPPPDLPLEGARGTQRVPLGQPEAITEPAPFEHPRAHEPPMGNAPAIPQHPEQPPMDMPEDGEADAQPLSNTPADPGAMTSSTFGSAIISAGREGKHVVDALGMLTRAWLRAEPGRTYDDAWEACQAVWAADSDTV